MLVVVYNLTAILHVYATGVGPGQRPHILTLLVATTVHVILFQNIDHLPLHISHGFAHMMLTCLETIGFYTN